LRGQDTRNVEAFRVIRIESSFLQRGHMRVREVLEDVGSVRRRVLVIESVDGRRSRSQPVWLGNVRVWDPKDGFGGGLMVCRLMGWLAGRAGMSGDFWSSI
jgi:hypothetical protein